MSRRKTPPIFYLIISIRIRWQYRRNNPHFCIYFRNRPTTQWYGAKSLAYCYTAKSLAYYYTARFLTYYYTARFLAHYYTAKSLAYYYTARFLTYYYTARFLAYYYTAKSLAYYYAWFTFSSRQHEIRREQQCEGYIRLVFHTFDLFSSCLEAPRDVSVNQSRVKGNENVSNVLPHYRQFSHESVNVYIRVYFVSFTSR